MFLYFQAVSAASAGAGGPGGGYMSPRIMSPRISSPAHPSGGGGGGGGGGRGGRRGGGFGGGGGGIRRDRQFIGQTIKITGGPYKGNVGIVKDATDSTARVELHSTCQTISVDRGHIAQVGAPTKDGSYTTYSRTPVAAHYGANATPMYAGSKTPMQGNQTPMYEGKYLLLFHCPILLVLQQHFFKLLLRYLFIK